MKDLYYSLKDKFVKSETVNDIYEARWVWYHSLLAFELFIIILILFAIAIILGVNL